MVAGPFPNDNDDNVSYITILAVKQIVKLYFIFMVPQLKNSLYKGGWSAISYASKWQIQRVIDVFTEEEFVVKLERSNILHPQLAKEKRVYNVLQGGEGVPRAHWFGKEDLAGKEYNVLVIDQLGPSLNDLFLFCSNKFTLKPRLLHA